MNTLFPVDIGPLISLTCQHHSEKKVLVFGAGAAIKKKVLKPLIGLVKIFPVSIWASF